MEGSKAEYGAGQMEVNLLHGGALETADRHTIFKHAVKEIAQANGLLATFMAKPFAGQPGSGGHLHMNVRDLERGDALFWDERGARPSALLTSFLAGIQTLAPACSLMYAPYINSFKRYDRDYFAPHANTAAVDDRTAAFRVTGEGASLRIENRLPGADANCYLSMAAMIACGLYGVQRGLREPALVGGALPADPVEALQTLDSSPLIRDILGPPLVNDIRAFTKAELRTYFREVTDWERQAYLEQV